MKTPKHNEEFRLRLRDVLNRAGVKSQTQFAELVVLSPSTIKNMKQGLSCSADTEAVIVLKLNECLATRKQPPITREWLFGPWQAKLTRAAKSPAKTFQSPRAAGRQLVLDEIPDLLTPGTAPRRMHEYYSKYLGSELGGLLASRSKQVIIAVERGDYHQQELLGLQIAKDAQEFPQIQAVGHYFAGEGIRLQGDLARPGPDRDALYARARREYERSAELNGHDPRPLRGTGRILERRENLEHAEKYFLQANALADMRRVNLPKDAPAALYLNHEYLRIIRHKIHCFLEQAQKSRSSRWNSEVGRIELRGWVQICESAHADLMQMFKAQTEWWSIEWFMGMVFLAKAWGFLNEAISMTNALMNALLVRRDMIRSPFVLTQVERDNLKWWCSVALSGKDVVAAQLIREAELLSAALDCKADPTALRKVDEMLRSLRVQAR